jgi:hypothetical protein
MSARVVGPTGYPAKGRYRTATASHPRRDSLRSCLLLVSQQEVDGPALMRDSDRVIPDVAHPDRDGVGGCGQDTLGRLTPIEFETIMTTEPLRVPEKERSPDRAAVPYQRVVPGQLAEGR